MPRIVIAGRRRIGVTIVLRLLLVVYCALSMLLQFFYRVVQPGGARLHSRADPHADLLETVIPEGAIIEASDKFTPVGSALTYVKCDIK